MVDPKKAAQILYHHFANLTTEQFVENLKRSCPEVFEQEQEDETTISESFKIPENDEQANWIIRANKSN